MRRSQAGLYSNQDEREYGRGGFAGRYSGEEEGSRYGYRSGSNYESDYDRDYDRDVSWSRSGPRRDRDDWDYENRGQWGQGGNRGQGGNWGQGREWDQGGRNRGRNWDEYEPHYNSGRGYAGRFDNEEGYDRGRGFAGYEDEDDDDRFGRGRPGRHASYYDEVSRYGRNRGGW